MKTMTADQLRQYRKREHEKSYLLIDVRQRAEYEEAHIPGSVLLPLEEFEEQVEALPEKHLIFYCRSGPRSMVAALTADFFNEAGKEIYNLEGGMLSWDGIAVDGIPSVKRFDPDGDMDRILEGAMNLEKGAFLFYEHILDRYPHAGLGALMEQVRDGELGHAKLIYSHLKKIRSDMPSFDETYGRLAGDILEGGQPLQDLVISLEKRSGNIKLDILEAAVSMEYRAFDLYRVISEQAEDEPLGEAFYALAQAEKVHMTTLLQALESAV